MSGTQDALLGIQSSGIKPTGLLNGSSVLSTNAQPNSALILASLHPVKTVLTGAVTATTLTTIFSASGKGSISFLACASEDTMLRTHRVKVTLDGVVIFDGSLAVIVTTPCVVIGSIIVSSTSGQGAPVFEPLVFNTSLLIEYSSSVTETNKSRLAYRYIPG